MNERTNNQKIILGIQHTLAMFGATVLVPALTGMSTSITLFSAGVGTLLFHWITKKKVPVFLGSSFAFMGGIMAIIGSSRIGDPEFLEKLAMVKGGLIVAGIIYIIFSILIKIFGYEKVNLLLPPIVTGPIIIVIGLRLSSSAVNTAFFKVVDGVKVTDIKAIIVTVCVLSTIFIVSIFAKGIFNLMPILFAIIVGYIVSFLLGFGNFDAVTNASFFSFMDQDIIDQLLTIPAFNTEAILILAPIALVTAIEHVGDITTNGAVVGKNFMIDPGVHRTIFGDGIATVFAGIIGGPANTTYGENTGVLAVTKVYDPSVIRIAAVFAIILGVFGKFGGLISSVPTPVTGAIGLVLYGMIAAVGIRILINAKINLGDSRNLLVAAVILVIGIGCDSLPIYGTVAISGLALAAVIGIILALILPAGKEDILS